MSKQAFLIALSFMSVVVGGGFASGQETLQFFTGYGIASIAGTLVSGLLFAFLGMQIARMSSDRSEEHTSELQSRPHLVCRLLLEKKKKKMQIYSISAISKTFRHLRYLLILYYLDKLKLLPHFYT